MSYDKIKRCLSTAESLVKAGDMRQAHEYVMDALEEGATLNDLRFNLSEEARVKLRAWNKLRLEESE